MRSPNRNLGYVFLLWIVFVGMAATADAQSVVYTSFGPGMTFNTNLAISTNPPSEPNLHEHAASFVSTGDFQLSQIDIALCYNSFDNIVDTQATNSGAFVELRADNGGLPGAVLESWTVPGPLPIFGTTAFQTLTAATPIQLASGNRYWIEVMQVGPHGFVDWGYSLSTLGTFLDSVDGTNWTVDAAIGKVLAFDVIGGPIGATKFEYMGVGAGQTIRVTATASGTTSAVLSFLDANGNPIGTSRTVNLSAGQAQSLDYRSTSLGRTEILPVVSPAPGNEAFSAPLKASAEVWDDLLAIGTVFAPGITAYPNAPAFAPQGLAGAQTLRITVFSVAPNPCAATLSFEDANGNPIGTTKLVNLTGGQSASLDLAASSASLRIGQRVEVQPSVTLSPMGSGGAQSVCPASVEVFDLLTGRTETFQAALPH